MNSRVGKLGWHWQDGWLDTPGKFLSTKKDQNKNLKTNLLFH
jgi:hypothetical protein